MVIGNVSSWYGGWGGGIVGWGGGSVGLVFVVLSVGYRGWGVGVRLGSMGTFALVRKAGGGARLKRGGCRGWVFPKKEVGRRVEAVGGPAWGMVIRGTCCGDVWIGMEGGEVAVSAWFVRIVVVRQGPMGWAIVDLCTRLVINLCISPSVRVPRVFEIIGVCISGSHPDTWRTTLPIGNGPGGVGR